MSSTTSPFLTCGYRIFFLGDAAGNIAIPGVSESIFTLDNIAVFGDNVRMLTQYPGGKNGSGVYQRIINQMPPHTVYIEAFLGSGAILRNKKPALANIGIDSDTAVISAWQFHGMENLTIIHADSIAWLAENQFSPTTLIYLDPPYLFDVRSSHRPIYRCELDYPAHVRLLDVIRNLTCMVMISGYWSDLYAAELIDWRSISFQAQTRSGKPATEWLWMNYPEPTLLHDYTFLGETFRQRERIKRKRERWKARLARMDLQERAALLTAIQEFSSIAGSGDYTR